LREIKCCTEYRQVNVYDIANFSTDAIVVAQAHPIRPCYTGRGHIGASTLINGSGCSGAAAHRLKGNTIRFQAARCSNFQSRRTGTGGVLQAELNQQRHIQNTNAARIGADGQLAGGAGSFYLRRIVGNNESGTAFFGANGQKAYFKKGVIVCYTNGIVRIIGEHQKTQFAL
jgi:hypothetical protein